MKRLYTETEGLGDWKKKLAAPDKHWRRGRSAFELAVSWELAAKTETGIPPEVLDVLKTEIQNTQNLFALPEHKVILQGKGLPSQTDLWALLNSDQGQISMAVEGKAGEAFDLEVGEWLASGKSPNSPENRRDRLNYLCGLLCLDPASVKGLRYQLLHRTAAAVIEARRFGISNAIMLVQSFDNNSFGFADFEAFGNLFGVSIAKQQLTRLPTCEEMNLWIGWVSCPRASDAAVIAAGGTLD